MKSRSSYLTLHLDGHDGRKLMLVSPSAYASRLYASSNGSNPDSHPLTAGLTNLSHSLGFWISQLLDKGFI